MDLIEHTQPPPFAHTLRQYYELTKPRIVMLAAFCAVIGMFLAADGMVAWPVLVFGTLGISLLAGAGFTFNCMVERGIDARMARTRARPAARGEVSAPAALAFAGVLGGLGAWLLLEFVNPLTMWLTLGTFVGYAVVYTVVLKPATPQNIVIGGASGAMPPLLGWAAVSNDVTPQALVLVLIVFVWTPPHFWALALYRIEDYKRAGLPMLPVTHGPDITRLHILLYTVLLLATSLLPFMIRMSGWLYLVSALVLGGIFLGYAWQLWRRYSDALARRTFRYSIVYLGALFAALLLDHWL
ncbi:MAG: protoheme IX farnesyltransferase [Burkholderiales bacterium]|nr:MAG: protoheme IX farnesyltransferase [Burkholderiales bacterium]